METIKEIWSQCTHLWRDHKKIVIGVVIVIIMIGLLVN